MSKKVTLKHIAADTGLSISTVSRALSQSGMISLPNVRKVLDSAHKLNYPIRHASSPNELPDILYIAIITNFHPGEFFASFFHGFAKASEKSNIRFGLFHVGTKYEKCLSFIESIKKKRFDGAVLFLPGLSKSNYHDVIRRVQDFPMISAAPLATPVMDTVAFDNYSGGHLVAKHFHQKGYKKIGIIQGPATEVETHLRKNGLVDYCDQHGLQIVWNYKTDYDISSGKLAYKSFSALSNKPDAIFAGNDALALGFMHSAQRDNLRIPEDVAIAGFDDIPLCDYQNPTLTSIHTPYEKLGKNIIDLLVEQLSLGDKNMHHSGSTKLVPVSLIERESS
jgi:DNA-binding LacI/PurR family transcriptional regulator